MDFGKNESKKRDKKEKTKQIINMFLARYFNWLLVLIVLIMVVAGGIFILKPKYEEVAKLTKNNEFGQEQEYSIRRQYLDKVKNLIKIYNKVDRSDVEKVNYILAERYIQEEIFSEVQSLVEKNGLLLEALKIEPVEEVKKPSGVNLTKKIETAAISLPAEIGRTKVTLSIVGADYFSLKSLISTMENNLALMDIISLDFDPGSSSAELVFYTYHLKKEK
jgi:uncharacterized protein (UPF0333 family)